jgi:phage terminase large subunit GpA-like protein
MLSAGEWRAEHPERGERIAGFHLNSLYSPLGWVSWPDLVREFLSANFASKKGDVSLLRVFVNTRLAKTFEEGTAPSSVVTLTDRAEEYALGTAPEGALCLTCGVDIQGDRIEAYAWGWGRDDESWLVDFRRFIGSPAQQSVWADLAAYLRQPLPHVRGELRILACGIDSGNDAASVYQFTRGQRYWLALKGSSLPAQPILGRSSAVEGTRGARVFPVGTDTAKTLIYGRLGIERPGPGYVHIPGAILNEAPDFFEQLTVERRVQKYKAGHPILRWIKPAGARNEALDCLVYALAAFHAIGGHRITPAGWARVEQQIRQPEAPKPQPAAQRPAPFGASPRRKNWATDWR